MAHNWTKILTCNDPSVAWDLFGKKFNGVFNQYAPWELTTFDVDPLVWSTSEMLTTCTELDQLKHTGNIQETGRY